MIVFELLLKKRLEVQLRHIVELAPVVPFGAERLGVVQTAHRAMQHVTQELRGPRVARTRVASDVDGLSHAVNTPDTLRMIQSSGQAYCSASV